MVLEEFYQRFIMDKRTSNNPKKRGMFNDYFVSYVSDNVGERLTISDGVDMAEVKLSVSDDYQILKLNVNTIIIEDYLDLLRSSKLSFPNTMANKFSERSKIKSGFVSEIFVDVTYQDLDELLSVI